jgi:hypothetical protein
MVSDKLIPRPYLRDSRPRKLILQSKGTDIREGVDVANGILA